MCDRLLPRSGRRCERPATHRLLVEATGEELDLCEVCAEMYQAGAPITYAPKEPRW